MALITVNQLRIGFRGPLLLDDVSCQIEEGQRIGLLGRNGAGKTTFMRILTGDIEPDGGEATASQGTTVSLLPQGVPQGLTGRAIDIVTEGVVTAEPDAAWRIEQRAQHLFAEMKLPAEAAIESLSSGMKRRVLLARALVSNPSVLLLDEPTNHLDVEAITWLEQYLARLRSTLLFVTHDRTFLQTLATRILEIDRGRLFDWSCDYNTFLTRKADALPQKRNKTHSSTKDWPKRKSGFGKASRLAERAMKGACAHSNKCAVCVVNANRRPERFNSLSKRDNGAACWWPRPIRSPMPTARRRSSVTSRRASCAATRSASSGPMARARPRCCECYSVSCPPQSGTMRFGTNLQIAYFDQLREQLDEERSVQENVGDGYDSVQINGRARHIIGYLQDFLFSPERARTPVRFLSGGERNRILLAKLFAKPANLIVLDEPTNDLDVETLELLEERLVQFEGTVLMVSHDRALSQ